MSKIENLIAVMATLRDPQRGCPWDLEQNFESIVPHTLEEAYEVAETIETGNFDALCEELGDLLFQVVFYARMAEERGMFDFSQVVDGIVNKLVQRHPHVFGDEEIEDTEIQSQAWESHKARERSNKTGDSGALAGVAHTLPALTRATKLQKRAAQVGFDWPSIMPVFDKIIEELDEVKQEISPELSLQRTSRSQQERIEEEIGDLLFACTNLARHAHVQPETALRNSNRKFEKRFALMEAIARRNSFAIESLELHQWEQLWVRVKSEEKDLEC